MQFIETPHRFIEKTANGRRFAIGDIHGCAKTFEAVLGKISLTKQDQLFLLGDYTGRGVDSIGVLNLIIKLLDTGYNVYPLMGNHEYNILTAYREYDTSSFYNFLTRIEKVNGLCDADKNILPQYLNFLQSLPCHIELDGFHLTHAGIDFKKDNPFADIIGMLQIRYDANDIDESKLNGKILLHGHKPIYIEKIQEKVDQKARVIPLDNGCVYTKPHKIYDHTRLGNLCCLELDNLMLIMQINIDE